MRNLFITLLPISMIFVARNIHNSKETILYAINSSTEQDSVLYNVSKIDSINNYYLIYARQGKYVYKIVSEKMVQPNCLDIKVGDSYRFDLRSVFEVNGRRIIPANAIYELTGWQIDKSTVITFEGDSIRDIFYATNIKGLCFVPSKVIE